MNVSEEDTQFAGTLIDGARMYAAAADAVDDKFPNSLHVLSHLLGMSIELAFKSYLKYKGVGTGDLKRMGHDLGGLYELARQFGFTHTGSRNLRLRVLGANYEGRIFAYPEEANLNVIVPKSLREVADEIIAEVFEVVKGHAVLRDLAGRPGLAIQSEYLEDLNPSAWAVR